MVFDPNCALESAFAERGFGEMEPVKDEKGGVVFMVDEGRSCMLMVILEGGGVRVGVDEIGWRFCSLFTKEDG